MRIYNEDDLYKYIKEQLDKADYIIITGNGGSLASALHISSDLLKFGYPILDFNNTSFLTALYNDFGFKDSYAIFLEKLRSKFKKANIFIIILTVHGGKILKELRNQSNIWSSNLYNLAKKALELNIDVLTLTSEKNLITSVSSVYYLIPSHIQDIESYFITIFHEVLKKYAICGFEN